MKAQTVFIYPDARVRHFDWLCIEQGERQAVQSGDESALRTALRDMAPLHPSVVLILPVEGALHTAVSVPRRQRRFLSRSLPFILEAQTAQDIEELHIVPGQSLSGDQLAVYAVPHERLCHLLELLADSELAAAALVLDTQVLALHDENAICIAWQPGTQDRVLVNTAGRGMACTRQNLSAWLDRLATEAQDQTTSLLLADDLSGEADTLAAEVEQFSAARPGVAQVANGWLPMLADLWLAAGPRRRSLTNLLCGPYEQVDAFSRWKHLLPRTALAASLLAVAGGLYFIADLRQTEQRAEAVWQATEALFAEAVGQDLTLQRQRALQQMEDLALRTSDNGAQQGPFLSLLARFDEAMATQPVALEELRFTADRAELQVQVEAESTQTLEALRSALEEHALTVTYSASRVSDGFRGNFRIQGNTE